jgi:hypothetical protein
MAARTHWQFFDPATPVLTFEYSFGPGTANALAVGVDGGLAIVSPPCRMNYRHQSRGFVLTL